MGVIAGSLEERDFTGVNPFSRCFISFGPRYCRTGWHGGHCANQALINEARSPLISEAVKLWPRIYNQIPIQRSRANLYSNIQLDTMYWVVSWCPYTSVPQAP